MVLAAFASLRTPESRAFYDRKRAEGKHNNAAVMCLARRRCERLARHAGQPHPLPATPPRTRARRSRLTALTTASGRPLATHELVEPEGAVDDVVGDFGEGSLVCAGESAEAVGGFGDRHVEL